MVNNTYTQNVHEYKHCYTPGKTCKCQVESGAVEWVHGMLGGGKSLGFETWGVRVGAGGGGIWQWKEMAGMKMGTHRDSGGEAASLAGWKGFGRILFP